jgi:hypothetical protein
MREVGRNIIAGFLFVAGAGSRAFAEDGDLRRGAQSKQFHLYRDDQRDFIISVIRVFRNEL